MFSPPALLLPNVWRAENADSCKSYCGFENFILYWNSYGSAFCHYKIVCYFKIVFSPYSMQNKAGEKDVLIRNSYDQILGNLRLNVIIHSYACSILLCFIMKIFFHIHLNKCRFLVLKHVGVAVKTLTKYAGETKTC